ncbi:hypothetical protein ALC56_05722 [Trachymyrmex septentrionalis]|uniref:Uncharacterized protein n=1 Tax=Trachymyrmex septentrionalis TaxID=34720 RepID=A0A195FIZ2_9HYME|nr:hypothetical protein ALC56_05722 [Trachymyrmex septentrionalis]
MIADNINAMRPVIKAFPARSANEARRKKRKVGHTMLALLMAYKLKFVALIPIILGGLILLKGTTLLAGFFFALFAAVLGLKIH